jgi:hypothetical protein
MLGAFALGTARLSSFGHWLASHYHGGRILAARR